MKDREHQHRILPQVGPQGLRRLARARVLLVGAGGLGCPVATYLVAGGAGYVEIWDDDLVEESNLARQVAYRQRDVGRPKVQVLAAQLREQNPQVVVEARQARFDVGHLDPAHLESFDLFIDAADNFATSYLLNDLALMARKPLLYAAVYRLEGRLLFLRSSPCLRCFFPETATRLVPNCTEAGVLSTLVGTIGLMQAHEGLKWLAGVAEPRWGELLLVDGTNMQMHRLGASGDCQVCRGELDYNQVINRHSKEGSMKEISCEALKERLDAGDIRLFDVRTQAEYDEVSIDGAVLIPLDQLEARASEIPKNGDVAIHCKSGGRSGQAVAYLNSQGYDNVMNVAGGITAWKALGY